MPSFARQGIITFPKLTSHIPTTQSEWIVDYGVTHHVAKYDCLFFSLNEDAIFFCSSDCALTIVGYGNIEYKNGVITNVYHVRSLSVILLLVPKLTYTSKNI